MLDRVFRISCTLRNTNCFGFGVVHPGIYGVPVTLPINVLVSDGGFATGLPVTENGIASSALFDPL